MSLSKSSVCSSTVVFLFFLYSGLCCKEEPFSAFQPGTSQTAYPCDSVHTSTYHVDLSLGFLFYSSSSSSPGRIQLPHVVWPPIIGGKISSLRVFKYGLGFIIIPSDRGGLIANPFIGINSEYVEVDAGLTYALLKGGGGEVDPTMNIRFGSRRMVYFTLTLNNTDAFMPTFLLYGIGMAFGEKRHRVWIGISMTETSDDFPDQKVGFGIKTTWNLNDRTGLIISSIYNAYGGDMVLISAGLSFTN